jgi:hypothetical protein
VIRDKGLTPSFAPDVRFRNPISELRTGRTIDAGVGARNTVSVPISLPTSLKGVLL